MNSHRGGPDAWKRIQNWNRIRDPDITQNSRPRSPIPAPSAESTAASEGQTALARPISTNASEEGESHEREARIVKLGPEHEPRVDAQDLVPWFSTHPDAAAARGRRRKAETTLRSSRPRRRHRGAGSGRHRMPGRLRSCASVRHVRREGAGERRSGLQRQPVEGPSRRDRGVASA